MTAASDWRTPSYLNSTARTNPPITHTFFNCMQNDAKTTDRATWWNSLVQGPGPCPQHCAIPKPPTLTTDHQPSDRSRRRACAAMCSGPGTRSHAPSQIPKASKIQVDADLVHNSSTILPLEQFFSCHVPRPPTPPMLAPYSREVNRHDRPWCYPLRLSPGTLGRPPHLQK